MTQPRVTLISLAVTTLGLASIGCGTNMKTLSTTVQGDTFRGLAYGGQQPVVGTTIQLYAASTNGYGKPYSYATGTSLLGTEVVTTDSNGAFTITNDYTCPSYSTEVYLTAVGGNPGLPQGSNANIALMAALGPCGALSENTHIVINELTTVASVWALSPFMSSITGVGTSSGNVTGLTNAFATVNKLVDTSAGSLPGPALPPGAVLPFAKMNLLADILAACVNSSGGVATDTSTACGKLFNASTVNGIAPTDTITAAMNLAKNPNLGTSISQIGLAAAPFQPTPGVVPTDFGLIITYSGGALSGPAAIAADAAGNLWVPNGGNNTVSKLDALGVTNTDSTGFLSGPSGFTAGTMSTPAAIAIDQSGSAWIANSGNSTVSKLSSDGSSATVYTGGGLSSPTSVAIDAGGNVWVANFGNSSVTQVSSTGILTNFTSAGLASPSALTVNPK